MVKVVILGGGISGLATAYYIQEAGKKEGFSFNIAVLEKEKRVGGKILSHREKGFLCEAGPAAFLDNRPETLKLVKDLGIQSLQSNESAKKRFIYTGKRLRKVPEGPKEFISSDILSLKGKIRVLGEVFTKMPQIDDESIANFGERHLGKEAQEKLISSMVTGIHAGDSEKLSLNSCFPVMRELEKAGSGSLIRAMFKKMKKAKKERKSAASPTGNLSSFIEGMETLVIALTERFKGRIITGKEVEKIVKNSKGFKIKIKEAESMFQADILIMALPAYSAAKVIGSFDSSLSAILSDIPYVPATVVCMGYDKKELTSIPEGFGFLVPKNEGRKILGCRWDSSTFKSRAPDDKVLLWAIVGGSIRPDLTDVDEKSLMEILKEELRETMGINSKPEFIKIFRHEKAIPQYLMGHGKLIQDIDRILIEHPGLFLTGNAFKGIGVNDCIKNASNISRIVVDHAKKEYSTS